MFQLVQYARVSHLELWHFLWLNKVSLTPTKYTLIN